MKVYEDRIEIEPNSVNQTLSVQPIGGNIKKVKIGFGGWGQQMFSMKVKSFEGRINPGCYSIEGVGLFADDVMTVDPFEMIEEA